MEQGPFHVRSAGERSKFLEGCHQPLVVREEPGVPGLLDHPHPEGLDVGVPNGGQFGLALARMARSTDRWTSHPLPPRITAAISGQAQS